MCQSPQIKTTIWTHVGRRSVRQTQEELECWELLEDLSYYSMHLPALHAGLMSPVGLAGDGKLLVLQSIGQELRKARLQHRQARRLDEEDSATA